MASWNKNETIVFLFTITNTKLLNVTHFDNLAFSERSLLVIATHQCNYDGILKVEFGKRVKLKNKYSDYYWVEFEGNEGWIAVNCVVFVPRNEGKLGLWGDNTKW